MARKTKENPTPREASSWTRIPTAKLVDPNNADANKAPQSLLANSANQGTGHVKRKVNQLVVDSSESESESEEQPREEEELEVEEVEPPRKIAKTTAKHSDKSAEKDKDGFLEDLASLEEIHNDVPKERKTADIDVFFALPIKDGTGKRFRECKLCHAKIVHESTTCRRHIEAFHVGKYCEWVKNTPGAVNRLPKYRAELKAARLGSTTQSMISDHFTKAGPKPPVMPYSDSLFRHVALEWLIATNQPIQALDHPKFKEMIDVAARAKEKVMIPAQKANRAEIIRMFRDYLLHLKNDFKGKGKVSFTCDAWQAGNGDAYFAVTAHWIEEATPSQWELKGALIGFTRMNESHTGERLGQALFKLIKRIGWIDKIGWVTSDNASNNRTMMRELARCYEVETGKPFLWEQQWIRCLAHIINISTQAILKEFSSASYAEEVARDADLTMTRDEVGMIRTIVVKTRSSSQRKEKFLNIQRNRGVRQPRMIPADMKVRWSSTFIMVQNAYVLRQYLELFVNELAADERDSEFLDILRCADNAQQAFSSETFPSLHLAIPALEALHTAWKKRLQQLSPRLVAPLQAGMEKVEDYYTKTEKSDAYLMAMVLNPETKMSHFKKHWSTPLYEEVRERIETIFSQRYLDMYGMNGPVKSKPRPIGRVNSLLMELDEVDNDEDDDRALEDDEDPTDASDAAKPWMKEFSDYLEHKGIMRENISIVAWWGRNSEHYPVWASLASDYLAIMASSVSSERAFSAGGITIRKHCNRLKGDIVEALQVLKCAIRTDLLVRPPMPSTAFEEELVMQDNLEEQMKQEVLEDLTKEKADGEQEAFLHAILDDDDVEENDYY